MAKNPLKIIGWLWHMYNAPFDNRLGDIKDLSIMVKITVLVLCLLVLLIVIDQDAASGVGNVAAGISAVFLVLLTFFWIGYIPFLAVRIVKFYLKKNRIINSD